MRSQIIDDKLKILPDAPGCYLMKNASGVIIYVGKAKILKKRVTSYFIGAHAGKVQKMIDEVADFELIITKNEAEALILESQLVKAHQPRYNVLLKDDKSYPYIAITGEPHPRLILTRQPQKRYRALFGPYVSAADTRSTIEVLNYIFPLRKCDKLPKKLCLYYHINQCLGPCEFPIETTIYEPIIKDIITFLRGNPGKVKRTLKMKMENAAERLEFEQAGHYKELITIVEQIFDKKGTHNKITEDTDVIGYAANDEHIAVQIFHVRDGSVVKRESDVFVYEGENSAEVIESYIHQFYLSKYVTKPKVIIADKKLCGSTISVALADIVFFSPQRGTKKELLQFAMENAKKALEQKALLAQNTYNTTIGAVEELGKILSIPTPTQIEIVDTSNLGNTNIVSAVVTFTNGLPNHKQYRKYQIKSTTVQDDYQALREVVYRRFYRKIMENEQMPDLFIVDGGSGHVNVAKEVFDSLNIKVKLIGLSKNDKHRTESVVLTNGEKIALKTTNSTYKLLGKMQEEVHRFVIDYHRKKRMQSAFSSELVEISGIGESWRKKLLAYFPHIDDIKKASIQELSTILPEKLAKNVYNYYQQSKN